jgi:hypothetical protein
MASVITLDGSAPGVFRHTTHLVRVGEAYNLVDIIFYATFQLQRMKNHSILEKNGRRNAAMLFDRLHAGKNRMIMNFYAA